MDYISGKRVRYYNIFYLILLLLGLGIFIDSLYISALAKYATYSNPIIEDDYTTNEESIQILTKYIKFFLLLAIPAYALNSYILFNKKKLLYSEHLIFFGMLLIGIIISLLGNLLLFADFSENLYFLSDWSKFIVPLLILPYVIRALYGAFGKEYKKINFIIRALLYIILFFVEFKLVAIMVKYYVKHYN